MNYPDSKSVNVQCLGQTGFRFEFDSNIIYVDPYLSNSVQEKEGDDLVRIKPIPMNPQDVTDADWILVTHEHRDHCDMDTLLPISKASPNCQFIGSRNVVELLKKAQIDSSRKKLANYDSVIEINSNLTIHPVPSAHPNIEIDSEGFYRWLGYVIQFKDRYFYHAGDTSVDEHVIKILNKFEKIDVAFIPVNENNYYRKKRNIVGNMSVREAYQFGEEIEAKIVVPTHWDMFEQNGVYKEEIEIIYQKMNPDFRLLIEPELV